MLEAALGGTTSTTVVGSLNNHQIRAGYRNPSSMTFEESLNGFLVLRHFGMCVNSLSISAAYGEIVSTEWDLLGFSTTLMAEKRYTSYYDVLPFSFTGVKVLQDDVEINTIMDFSLTLTNNLSPINIIRRNIQPSSYVRGNLDIELSMTSELNDYSQWNKFSNATKFSVNLSFESGNESLNLYIPNLRWQGLDKGVTPYKEVTASLGGKAFRVKDDSPLIATLITAEAKVEM